MGRSQADQAAHCRGCRSKGSDQKLAGRWIQQRLLRSSLHHPTGDPLSAFPLLRRPLQCIKPGFASLKSGESGRPLQSLKSLQLLSVQTRTLPQLRHINHDLAFPCALSK
jgi:hypothetical protein